MSDLLSPGGQSILEPAKPGTVMDGPRLLLCYDCQTLTKIAPFLGPVERDVDLERAVGAHQHLERGAHDVHMQLFPTTADTWERLDPVETLRKEMMANNIWIQEYRVQVGEDAVKCHREHGQPEYPGKPCIDYKTDKKRLGGGLSVRVDLRKRDPHGLQYLCTYCPYESTVVTEKRWRKGAYNL